MAIHLRNSRLIRDRQFVGDNEIAFYSLICLYRLSFCFDLLALKIAVSTSRSWENPLDTGRCYGSFTLFLDNPIFNLSWTTSVLKDQDVMIFNLLICPFTMAVDLTV